MKISAKRDDLDFIYIATPWDWHAPMAVAAMTSGKTHRPSKSLPSTRWKNAKKLVDTSEKTRRHCMIMEKLFATASTNSWSST